MSSFPFYSFHKIKIICNFKTLLSKSVSAIMEVTFTTPTPCPACLLSWTGHPSEDNRDRNRQGERERKVLQKSNCQFLQHPELLTWSQNYKHKINYKSK
jgi:hypothetical protein